MANQRPLLPSQDMIPTNAPGRPDPTRREVIVGEVDLLNGPGCSFARQRGGWRGSYHMCRQKTISI